MKATELRIDKKLSVEEQEYYLTELLGFSLIEVLSMMKTCMFFIMSRRTKTLILPL